MSFQKRDGKKKGAQEKPIIGSTILWLDEIDSTNRFFSGRSKNLNGTIVAAGYQTEGRGQRGNAWESNAFENLTFSIYLEPSFLKVSDQFMLSKAVSLGVKDFLDHLVQNVSIKWPNDIYISTRKVAGILIENAVMGNSVVSSVVGIGLNTNQTSFADDLPNPTSLAIEKGTNFELNSVLESLIQCLNERYLQLVNGDYQTLSDNYLGALYQLNKYFGYKTKDGAFEARIVGVKSSGEIVLETREGRTLPFGFKELTYLVG